MGAAMLVTATFGLLDRKSENSSRVLTLITATEHMNANNDQKAIDGSSSICSSKCNQLYISAVSACKYL